MVEITELQAQMAQAIANNDVKAIEELASQIVKGKSDRRKAEAEALQKEAEALAGQREATAIAVYKAVKKIPGIVADLEAVKAKGFTFKLDDEGITHKSVALTVPTVKTRKSGGGNGGAGKTKDEYGMSLAEVYVKYHTAEDDTKLAEAELKDREASEKLGKTTNSNQWRVKNEVKKRAIANGELQPVK